MKGSLIVIEGPDGSGKSTQSRILEKRLRERGGNVEFLHFPMYHTPTGKLISEFLRGDFGKVEDVHPKLVATLFAINRQEYRDELVHKLESGTTLILDRYVGSNIAYQSSKLFISGRELQVNDLIDWIHDFEYRINRMPIPDIEVLLKVSDEFTEKTLNGKREGKDREYLQGEKDIHETPELQVAVNKMYDFYYAGLYGGDKMKHGSRRYQHSGGFVHQCCDIKGEMKSIDQIHEELFYRLSTYFPASYEQYKDIKRWI